MARVTNTQTWDNLVAKVIREAGSAKAIGRMTDTSPRTVERWRTGESTPSASILMMLISRSREIAQTVLTATGLTNEWLDAEEARLLAELMNLRAQRGRNGATTSQNAADRLSDAAERLAIGRTLGQ
jgi:hypothetical protein